MANIFSQIAKAIKDFFTPTTPIQPTVQPTTPKIKTVEEQTKTFFPPEERQEFIPQDDTDFTVDYEIDEPDEEVTVEEMARLRMEEFIEELKSNDREHLANRYWNMYLDAIEQNGEYAIAKAIATYGGWGKMTEGLVQGSEGSPRFIACENEFNYVLYNRALDMTEAVNLSDIIESEDSFNE